MKNAVWRAVVSAIGAAWLCCLFALWPLVSPSHNTLYHWSDSVSALFLPPLLCWIVLSAAFTVILLLPAQGSRLYANVRLGFFLLLPWATLKSITLVRGADLRSGISCGYLLAALLFLLASSFLRWPKLLWLGEQLEYYTQRFLPRSAIWCVLSLVQLLWLVPKASDINNTQHASAGPAHAAMSPSGPRIVWILLDELSYEQVYGHRADGLALPSFDRLAQQSSIFTHVRPAGIRTEIVMPSLIEGTPADAIRIAANGSDLFLHDSDTQRWSHFNEFDSVFQDALTHGYHTAVAGWFNPYCRILPDVLDHCFWHLRIVRNYPALSLGHMVDALLYLLAKSGIPALSRLHNPMQARTAAHIEDFNKLQQEGDLLLNDPRYQFLLIHMPVPHPEGIYNRQTHQFTREPSTYLDNLALADAYMAHVRSILEANGSWDNTTVVIMGDHSWRTALTWKHSPYWSAEEDRASHGGAFDDRPGYIVKLAGQHDANMIADAFPAVKTRQLFQALMSGQVRTTSNLNSWVTAATAQATANR